MYYLVKWFSKTHSLTKKIKKTYQLRALKIETLYVTSFSRLFVSFFYVRHAVYLVWLLLTSWPGYCCVQRYKDKLKDWPGRLFGLTSTVTELQFIHNGKLCRKCILSNFTSSRLFVISFWASKYPANSAKTATTRVLALPSVKKWKPCATKKKPWRVWFKGQNIKKLEK